MITWIRGSANVDPFILQQKFQIGVLNMNKQQENKIQILVNQINSLTLKKENIDLSIKNLEDKIERIKVSPSFDNEVNRLK